MEGKAYKIALVGNPNVGKSTVFNALTGLKQHTGNWTGKTVRSALGSFSHKNKSFEIHDLPGLYSLNSQSPDEKVASDNVREKDYDLILIVADATCLERNLNLAFQISELSKPYILCVNLLDEAKKKGIEIDLLKLEKIMSAPVVGTSARSKEGLSELKDKMLDIIEKGYPFKKNVVTYPETIEASLNKISDALKAPKEELKKVRQRSILLLKTTKANLESFNLMPEELGEIIAEKEKLQKLGYDEEKICDEMAIFTLSCSKIAACACAKKSDDCHAFDRRLDKIATSKKTGIPLMILLFGLIFFITIKGANYPSDALSKLFSYLYDPFSGALALFLPPGPLSLLMDGVYLSLTAVIAVMLPPMAIFFPLFTLLEDFGYLPRIAFNLDHFFKKAGTQGKQALTMCMGFGCNAVGVTGCRIIESEKERLIAIITNSFVPCNGRFPALIAIAGIFFAFQSQALGAVLLLIIIIMSVIITLLVSKLLSKTLLKGTPSSFVLELPPYRKPEVLKVVVRSLFDRTLKILGRAVLVSAPAGAVLWLLSKVTVGDVSLLLHFCHILDPLGKLMGLDGMILCAFILGFPANEIVLPILFICYGLSGGLDAQLGLLGIKALLISNGWTVKTAVCMLIFMLMHFPCGTTLLTIGKETGSAKWTLISFLLPLALGIGACMAVNIILSPFF